MSTEPTYTSTGAEFDDTRRYRFRLWRHWGAGPSRVLWVMLNPSTADATVLDQTIRRCVAFSRAWGFDGLEVCNLFALRSTDPAALYDQPADDLVRRENDRMICEVAYQPTTDLIVCAWGAHGRLFDRGRDVRRLLPAGRRVVCLGLTKDGEPRHPLYLPRDAAPLPFDYPSLAADVDAQLTAFHRAGIGR